jgi:hypothetical protein
MFKQPPCRDARVKNVEEKRGCSFGVRPTPPNISQENYDLSLLRSTPSFFMRLRKVPGLTFELAAAPLGPLMRRWFA